VTLRPKPKSKIFAELKQKVSPRVMRLIQQSPLSVTPRTLNLDISWACNLSCTMCSAQLRVSKQNRRFLAPEQFKRILEQLPRLNHIYFMGLGEPLMNPHLPEFISLARKKHITTALITNGMLLTEKIINRLDDNLKRVSISIDTSLAEKFNAIRKGAQLSSVVENARRLKIQKPELEIRILAVMMRETFEDLPELVKLAKHIGASAVDVSHIMALDEETDNSRITLQTPQSEAILKQASELAHAYGITLLDRPLEPRMRPCLQPWLNPLIMLDGSLLPCCFMDRSPSPVNTEWYNGVPLDVAFHHYAMGNIFESSFQSIWNNSDFRRIRKVINHSEVSDQLTLTELNRRRESLSTDEKFAYCRVCLWRWNSAC